MSVYVARHGQTDWNHKNMICGGDTDIDLNEEGRRQAAELAKLVKGENIDFIIASTMVRAVTTAGIVAEECGLSVSYDDRLREQRYGNFEATNRLAEEFIFNKGQLAMRFPGGGESMMMVAARVYPLLDEICEKYPDKNVLLVCHGGMGRIIRSYFVNMTNEEFVKYSMGNCKLEKYEIPTW